MQQLPKVGLRLGLGAPCAFAAIILLFGGTSSTRRLAAVGQGCSDVPDSRLPVGFLTINQRCGRRVGWFAVSRWSPQHLSSCWASAFRPGLLRWELGGLGGTPVPGVGDQ